MKAKTKISALQLFLMLFLSRVVISLTMNAQVLGRGNLLDNIVSSLLLLLFLFVFSIPLFLLHKRHPEQSLPAVAESSMGGLGYGVSAVYALYFAFMNLFSLSLFLTLVLNTVDPTAAKWSIAAVVCAVALYGALRGIETVSRASICIFVLFLLGMGAIFIALLPNVNGDYLRPPLTDGSEQMLRGFFVFTARCTSLAEFAVLMPFAKGGKVFGFTLWNFGVTAFLALLLLFVVSCLGEYALLQVFPVYTLSSMAEIAGMQRLDALFIGIAMMALVVRLACGWFAVSECISRVMKPRKRTLVLCVLAAVTAVAAVWICGSASRAGILFQTELLLPVTLLVSAVLPLLVLIWDCLRKAVRR